MRRFLPGAAIASTTLFITAAPAHAQTDNTVLVDTAVPDNFDRGRNVSVLERGRPDYDPLGIQAFSFVVKPSIEIGQGGSDNVYLTSTNRITDSFYYLAPTVLASSDWQRDQVLLSAAGLFQRFVKQTARNQSVYDLRSLGRKDLGSYLSLTGEAQYAKQYETPDTGAINAAESVLSTYHRGYLAARGQYNAGQARIILAADRTSYSFSNIDTGAGIINQRDRDRVITRGTGEAQYAFTPSVSIYGQTTYSSIDYSRRLLSGAANRDSTGWRIIGGLNFDLAGLMRGKIGVGYLNRDYRSAAFRDVHGLSVEAKIEYFPSELTTYTLQLSRTLQDSNIGNISAYFDNAVSGKVDHELLNNLIVGATAEYRRQTYIDSPLRNNFYRIAANATYLSSRFVALNANLAYLNRTTEGQTGRFRELRGQIGVTLRR